MTKKHFVALAAALKSSAPLDKGALNDDTDCALIRQWRDDCRAVASVCAQFNPNFNRAKFLKACGMED